jgi:hypothetical protein
VRLRLPVLHSADTPDFYVARSSTRR